MIIGNFDYTANQLASVAEQTKKPSITVPANWISGGGMYRKKALCAAMHDIVARTPLGSWGQLTLTLCCEITAPCSAPSDVEGL